MWRIGFFVIVLALGCDEKKAIPEPEAKAVEVVAPTTADAGASARIPRSSLTTVPSSECEMISRDPEMSPDRVRITNGQIVVEDGVYFEDKTSIIPTTSYGLLNEIAFEICANPSLNLVEIGVHTNSRGSDIYNLKMSEAKAEAIREYLADFIAPERLVAKGYGESRAQNSRVEFRILE